MSTISTDRLYATLVRDALAFVPRSGPLPGVAISASLGVRMYRQAAPRNASYPYAVFSLRTPQIDQGNNSLKQSFDFEGFVWSRPRSTQAAAENIGDAWAAYLRTLRDISSGLAYCTDVTCESLPVMSSPADSSYVQVLVRAKLHVWPQYVAAEST